MHSAELSTPAPTYGTSRHSSSPWTVPSSPNGPCSAGNTTSAPARPRPGSSASTSPSHLHTPVAVDLDLERVVAALAQPLANRRRRRERDLMLGRPAAAEHGNAQ